MNITEVPLLVEKARGCGYRKPGGIYLRTDDLSHSCCRLPHVLDVCPTCGEGYKPSRAPRKVDVQAIFRDASCRGAEICRSCPLSPQNISNMKNTWLIWVGSKYYPQAEDFLKEANEQGVSRRVFKVPRGFILGESYVLLAHRQVYVNPPLPAPGDIESIKPPRDKAIFTVFKPDRIEYVCEGTESPRELDNLVRRGLTPVRVVRDTEKS